MLKCWFDSDRRLQVPEHIGNLNCTILGVSTEWEKGVPNYRTIGGDLQLTVRGSASGKVLKQRPALTGRCGFESHHTYKIATRIGSPERTGRSEDSNTNRRVGYTESFDCLSGGLSASPPFFLTPLLTNLVISIFFVFGN